jgi:uncharacterized protein involved in exopolysaccharide biosynthesis
MEVMSMLRIMQRWWGAILSVVLTTLLVLGFRIYSSERVYETKVKLQLTAPQSENTDLYDRYQASSLRDEMTVARNNFVELLTSREVYQRTIQKLSLQGADAVYTIDVLPLRDSDFIYITIRARTPALAERIANVHADAAIAYYGEIRAKPATAEKDFINSQLSHAEVDLKLAEQSFNEFKITHDIGRLDSDLASARDLIQRLQEERNQRMIEGPTSLEIQTIERRIEQLQLARETAVAQGNEALAKGLDDAVSRNEAQLADLRKNTSPTDHIDTIIAVRERDLETLIGYEPEYNELDQKVQQAQSKYQLLQSKLTEATLRENNIKTASYIQVVEPALAPLAPAGTNAKVLLILGAFSSLGVGVLLAFLLDYLTRRPVLPLPPAPKPAPKRARRKSSKPVATPIGAPPLNGTWSEPAATTIEQE